MTQTTLVFAVTLLAAAPAVFATDLNPMPVMAATPPPGAVAPAAPANPVGPAVPANPAEPVNPIPQGTCTFEVMQGMIKQCCKAPYTGFRNCTTFAANFHWLCEQDGIECRTLHVNCGEDAHAMNLVHLSDGLWYVIEPQGRPDTPIGPGFSDPDNIPAAVLEAVRESLNLEDCEVKVVTNSPDPLPTNTNPGLCAIETWGSRGFPAFQACENCCVKKYQAWVKNRQQAEDWYENCYLSCYSKFHPHLAAPTPVETNFPFP